MKTDCTEMECVECGITKEIPARGKRSRYPCSHCGEVTTYERS